MSIYLANPACYQGDPGNPPEFESDNTWECSICGESYDADEDGWYEVQGHQVCYGCLPLCRCCEEHAHDDVAMLGRTGVVVVEPCHRDYAFAGTYHTACFEDSF